MSTWLYHITSISNLASILQTGNLISKNRLQASQTSHTSIAYEHIQDRRFTTAVPCGPGGVLHDYVPFYFARRSPMLYAIHKGGVPSYTSGQDLILHLLTTAEAIATAPLGFAFSDGHAVIRYTRFYDKLTYLNEAIDQEIMTAKYWNDTPHMTATKAAVIRALELYGLPGYQATRIEVQKLVYFLKIAGDPALQDLEYCRFHYGPYANNLSQVFQQMEGHYIRGYGDGSGRAQIQVLPAGHDAAEAFLGQTSQTHRYLERVGRLIEGFETPYGMEMLATLHWVAQEDSQAATDCQVAIQRVHEWSDRKKSLFKPYHLEVAWQHLEAEGWLNV